MAIEKPNFTQVPNEIFDKWMSELSGVEFKILMAICRKTFGWDKRKDKISYSQFIDLSGTGRRQISDAIKKLILLDLIEVNSKVKAPCDYSIKVEINKSEKETSLSKLNTLVCEKETSLHAEKKPDCIESGAKKKLTKEIYKESNIYNNVVDLFFHYYEQIYNIKPIFNSRQGKQVKDIIKMACLQNSVNPLQTIKDKFDILKDKSINNPQYSNFDLLFLINNWNKIVKVKQTNQIKPATTEEERNRMLY